MPLPPPHNLSQPSALSLPSSPLPSLESMKSMAHKTHLGLNTPPRKFIQEKKKRKKTEPWPGETEAIQLSATQLFTQSTLLLYCLLLFHSRHSNLCHFDCKFVSQNEQFSTGVCLHI